jgi:gas vesicle protein
MISEHDGAHMASHGANTALAFLLGSVVGAAVGLLIAPSSGEETRRKIGGAAHRVADKVRENVDKVRDWKDKAETRMAGGVEAEQRNYQ